MAWIDALDCFDKKPLTEDWQFSYQALKEYENIFTRLSMQYSMFELSLNVNFGTEEERGRFFKAFKECYRTCRSQNGFIVDWAAEYLPRCLIVFVFRCYFESGNGNDLYKCAAIELGHRCKPNDFVKGSKDKIAPLTRAWKKIFGDDFGDQKQGVPEWIFKSRCWLIKNFQQNAGNSQLCHAVRYFKNFGDKALRLRVENYPFDVVQRFGGNFKRLLESPSCRLEREYLIDFADNGTVDNERFAWFEQLDDKSKAALCELLQVTIDGNVPCFCIPKNYDFGADNEVDSIVVKFMLRGADASICPFVRRNGRWRYSGDGEHLKQPIWKVTSIIKYEYSNNAIVRTEDLLGKALSECCNDERCGAFLINAENARVGIYAPFSRRRILRGKYFAYAFEYSDGNHFEVRRHVKNSANAQLVCVNGNPIGVDRSITVENESIALVFNDVNGKEHSFSFGINRLSPIREEGAHEKFISRQDPNHLFINYKKWPLYNIDADWYYDVDGGLVKGAIGQNCLYKTGRLVFNYGGNQFEEHRVTFVDFSSEEVFAKFPVLGIGETKTITLSDCGALNRTYIVRGDCTTFGIRLPGGVWQLNVPIRRDGVVFRTEVLVSVSIDVRVDSDRNACSHTIVMSHLIDDENLLKRLAVEGFNAQHERIIYFLIAFSYSSVNDLVCREAAVMSMKHLVAAHAVCAEPFGTDIFQQPSLHICLNGIVHLDVIGRCQFRNMIHSLVKEIHVVVVERSGNAVKLLYCVEI